MHDSGLAVKFLGLNVPGGHSEGLLDPDGQKFPTGQPIGVDVPASVIEATAHIGFRSPVPSQ